MRKQMIHYLGLIFLILTVQLGYGQSKTCSEVRLVNEIPQLYVDGEYQAPFAYMSYLGEAKQYREMAAAGIRIFNVPAYLGDQGINSSSGIGCFRPSLWSGVGQYNLSSLYKDMEAILNAKSDALLVIRIHLDPPQWWQKENPSEMCLLPDGSEYRVSFASLQWRREAGQALADIVKQVLEGPYGQHLMGIHVAAGMTEEWFYHYKGVFYDESGVRQQAFRHWLQKRYQHDEAAFQRAWQDDNLDFQTVETKDISGNESTKGWRDSKLDRGYFDTFDFQAELMADNIQYFCKIVKDVSSNCLLTGAFYGYHYFVTDPRRGHGALHTLLDSPYLDYLSSPNDYGRKSGEDWPPMVAISSLRLHGKLWLAENDTRTYLTQLLKEKAPDIDPGGDWYTSKIWLGPESHAESHGLVLKNLGRMLTGGYGGWWFDMWGGWFSDSTMMSIIEHGMEIATKEKGLGLLSSEVAVVVDERLQFWDRSYGGQTGHILQNRYALGKTGAPYDLYLRTDLSHLKRGEYKVVWLMGLLELTADDREIIDELRASGTTVLYTDDQQTVKFSSREKKRETMGGLRFTAAELATFWAAAGVHLYSSPGDVLYVGQHWLTLHSGQGGNHSIFWPGDFVVKNVMSNQILDSDQRKTEIQLKAGETILLEVREK